MLNLRKRSTKDSYLQRRRSPKSSNAVENIIQCIILDYFENFIPNEMFVVVQFQHVLLTADMTAGAVSKSVTAREQNNRSTVQPQTATHCGTSKKRCTNKLVSY